MISEERQCSFALQNNPKEDKMKKVQIMVIGKNASTINEIENTLKAFPDWNVKTFTDKEAAISFYQQGFQDIVIFSDELDSTTATGLKNLFSFQEPEIVLLEEQAPALMITAIKNGIKQREAALKPVIRYEDDTLRNARFNINIA